MRGVGAGGVSDTANTSFILANEKFPFLDVLLTYIFLNLPRPQMLPFIWLWIQVGYSGQNFNVWVQQKISSWEFGEVRKQTAKNKFISQVFALPPSSPHQYKLKPNYSILEKNLILGESYCAFKRTFVISPKISLEIKYVLPLQLFHMRQMKEFEFNRWGCLNPTIFLLLSPILPGCLETYPLLSKPNFAKLPL